MKKIISINYLLLSSVVLLITSCVKQIKDSTPQLNDFSNQSRVQVFNATIAATRNFIYVDGRPVNGVSLIYGGVFPASLNTSFSIPAGFRAFLIRDTLSTSLVQPPMSFAENFQGERTYTIFMYDTVTAAKQKTVQTDIVIPADTTARVRVANFVYFPGVVPGIDIFSKKRNDFIVTNLLPTQVTDFFPYASALNDTLYVTESGNPSNRLDTLNGFNPTARRSYTLIFRGRWRTNEAGGAANPRVLSSFINY
jgi:hypothetical protein